jgi:hypothetical protein
MEVGTVYFYMDDILCDLKVFFDIDDADEELTSKEFFRIVTRLPCYKGAVRQRMEIYAHDHEDEIEAEAENMKRQAQAVTLTPEQLRTSPKLGAMPAAGQGAPMFEVQAVA